MSDMRAIGAMDALSEARSQVFLCEMATYECLPGTDVEGEALRIGLMAARDTIDRVAGMLREIAGPPDVSQNGGAGQ